MALGTAPFGPGRAGSLNFDPPRAFLYWEPYLPRLRVVAGEATLADTRAARMLHETGQLPLVYVPEWDIRLGRLERDGHAEGDASKGESVAWSLRGGANEIARGHPAPPLGAEGLAGHLTFHPDKVDAWDTEDDRGYAHPPDPYHCSDVLRASAHVVVPLGDAVLAESDRPAMLFETGLPPRYYLVPLDVRWQRLAPSATLSDCPYKGPGQHWHAEAGGRRVEDAAWSLSAPLGDAVPIRDWLCFYPGKVKVEVGGERLPPG